MNRILVALVPALILLVSGSAVAAPVPMTAASWELQGAAEFAEIDGRQAIRIGAGSGDALKGGEAVVRDTNFATGTIEVDVLASGVRDFVGLDFHMDDSGNDESFYLRPHMNGNPDSTQYTPVANGSTAWQIFSGDGFESQRRFNYGHWMHLRADIYADSALITIDGAPALVIPHLKGHTKTGAIGFHAAAGTYFANLSVTPIAGYADPNPAPPLPPLNAGTVAAWQVSPAMPEREAMDRAARDDWSGVPWQRIPVESNGIDNLSLAGADAAGRHTYIARFTARSGVAQTTTMHFGFSDKVHVYLNGRLLYAGEDLQASRDYRFLGIVGFWDTLFLPLEKGENTVSFVVTDDTNGGTAALARFEPAAGLTIE